MIPIELTDLTLATARAMERSEVPADKQAVAIELLKYSAGTQNGITVYRNFYVAAKLIEQSISDQKMRKAGDAEFSGLVVTIQSLLSTQHALDQRYNVVVPLGFEAGFDVVPVASVNLQDGPVATGVYW